MRYLMLSITLTACGTHFQSELFTHDETATPELDANVIDSNIRDSGIPDSYVRDNALDRETSVAPITDSAPVTARCCGTGTQPDPICAECPTSGAETCSIEGLGCRLNWPSYWTPYICTNGVWVRADGDRFWSC